MSDRQEWMGRAEYDTVTFCGAHERVSDRLADYLGEDRDELIAQAKRVRLAASRLLRTLENPRARLFDVRDARISAAYLVKLLTAVQDRADTAAQTAEAEAIAKEVARRQTDEAWERELARRAKVNDYLSNRGWIR